MEELYPRDETAPEGLGDEGAARAGAPMGDEGGASPDRGRPVSEWSSREVGVEGEDMAVAYLERRGYEILERNWRSTVGEVDVVALAPLSDEFDEEGAGTAGAAVGAPCADPLDDAGEPGEDDVAPVSREVVLVEVKTRLALGSQAEVPELAVGRRKRNRYRRLALMYLALHSEFDSVRFDVIAINIVGESLARLRHLMGAFSWED